MILSVLAMGLSALLSFVMMPLIIKTAVKLEIFDIPNHRSSHRKPTPLLGGLVITFSAVFTIVFFGGNVAAIDKFVLLITLGLISSIGVIDDITNLSAKLRLALILFLALIIAGLFVSGITYYSVPVSSMWMSFIYIPLIVFWITGITNAMNFVDGLDGLASGLSMLSLFGFGAVLYIQNKFGFELILSMAVLGAVIGFFPYNRHKAQVFMGDAGSMFLGFFLSSLSVIFIIKAGGFIEAIIPICFLFIPIMDLSTSILRRIAQRNPIFKADKMHFHHLLARKYGAEKAVFILCGFQGAFVVIGLTIYLAGIFAAGWIAMAAVAIGAHIVLYKYYRANSGTRIAGNKQMLENEA